MLCVINNVPLANDTLSGGVALNQTRINVQRTIEIVVPLSSSLPVLLDRNKRRTTIDFQVARIHASAEAADKFVADHDAAIPSSGDVQFVTTSGAFTTASASRYFLHAKLVQHQLVQIVGKATVHAYRIEGGNLYRTKHFVRLLETGAYRLLESGGRRSLEHD